MSSKQTNNRWDAEADVVVVGFGGAGACAALEAKQNGADVLVLECFNGGGSTAASGAVVYAGGGTEYQKAAGYEDTPEEMYKYLKFETGDIVKEETLRRFCEGSADMIKWLERQGVPFEASMCPFKTSYPTDDYYLYFSGSENNGLSKAVAKAAPRGHRAKGPGISGLKLFHALEDSVYKQGIKVRCQTRVESLVFGDGGKVIGVAGRSIAPGKMSAKVHSLLSLINSKANTYMPPLGKVIDVI
ncbi:MAG: FAD-dependent oxidoreductase, partial [Smithellaceae bacterium]|nr:FAD-dependent oxidoreductase [Smithellaceae bacterium]